MSAYTIFVNGEATDFARSTKATVVAEAERLRAEDNVKGLIEVRTKAGATVHSLDKVGRVITKFTKPYTKTIDAPEGVKVKLPKGYTLAYTRPENDAAVARNMEAEKDERYAVVRLSTSEVLGYVPTTRDAGQVMKAAKPAKATAA